MIRYILILILMFPVFVLADGPFETLCIDYDGEADFHEFLDGFLRLSERQQYEACFMLLYQISNDRGFIGSRITLGIVVDRFIKTEGPLYIRIFDHKRFRTEKFEGSEGPFFDFYNMTIQKYAGMDIVLAGIPIVFFDPDIFLETGIIRSEIKVPVR